jgi:4-hydroxyphenylacetate 3-monooxygenase
MLKSGADHLAGLRDGRVVYVGKERVEDVTSHPAFRNGARTLAGLYDLAHDPKHRDLLSFEEGGERFSTAYLLPRSQADLMKRMQAHKLIADRTHGLFGRSPDHVSSFVAGMVIQAEVLDRGGPGRISAADNLRAYYKYARAKNLYIAYGVVPAPGARDQSFAGARGDRTPELRVVSEDDDGVVVSGMKLLATGAVFADEVWIGNVQPLAPDRKKEAITFAIPINTPGLSLWSRKPMEPTAATEFDNPLSYRFDETDSILIFENVKVPWERVFCHDDPILSQQMYYSTASHCFGNHQANVRCWAKLQLMVGLASEIARVGQTEKIPAVRELLGRLAALEAMLAGMIHGQVADYESLGNGYVSINRRYMYGALTWCTESYAQIVDSMRELMGGGVFQLPADISIMHDDKLKEIFESYWGTASFPALHRLKVFKLAWDLLGSEFGSRHWQYERFYAGPPYVVRSHSFREAPWEAWRAGVTDLMATYDVPEAPGAKASGTGERRAAPLRVPQ